MAESHPSHKAFVEKFQNALQNASNGNITVELYPNSQLGSLAENMEAMRIGDLEMAALNDSIVAGIVPEYNLVGLPFLWTSLDAAHEAMDGDFGQALDKKLDVYKRQLHNNAGVNRRVRFENLDVKTRDFIMGVNILGVWNMTKAVYPYMLKEKYGRIINTSSVTGTRVVDEGQTTYALTKGAVSSFTKALAYEAGPYGITVNAVLPGLSLIHILLSKSLGMWYTEPNENERKLY